MRRILAAGLLRSTHRTLWSHLQTMKRVQWLTADNVLAYQNKGLGAILRGAVANVPFYRDLARENGWNPAELTHSDLGRFPLVDKRTLTENQANFLSEPSAAADRIAENTGGSSGVLFGFYYDRRFKEYRRATDYFSRILAGWRPGDPTAVVWGHRGDVRATATRRQRLAEAVMHRRITLNAFDMDEETLADYAARLVAHRPTLIVGYATSLAFLAEFLTHNAIETIRPHGIISSAETLTDEQRRVIESRFGCPVFNRYGSREFANVAQQCSHGGGLHIFADRIYVEVARPDGTPCLPGERGEIVITDLINAVMPFIRYRTGDLGVLAAEPCPCGRGLPLLARVEGRTSEIIVGKNGKYYSFPGPTYVGSGIAGIGQMQIIQDTLEAIEVKIAATDAWTDDSHRLLVRRIQDLLGDIDVKITHVDGIPPSASGKYRFTISNVSPFAR